MTYCKYCGADLPPNKKIRDNKQIKIEELIPYMKNGYMVCQIDGRWAYTDIEPILNDDYWCFGYNSLVIYLSECLNIAPAEDWTKSLIKVGGK